MENKRVETTYVAKLDKASYSRVSKELKAQSADQVKSAKVQLDVQKDINTQLRKNAKEADKANKERAKSIKQEKTRLELLEKQNTATRNRVGSIGDVDSSLSAIRGGTSAITGTNIAGLEQVAGVFELTEAVVQLKGAAPAAKEAIGGLIGSIASPTGLALTAAAAVATVGVALLSKTIGKDFADSVRDLKADVEATNTVIDDISTGKTYDQLFQDRAALLTELDATGQKLGDVNSKIGEFTADLGTNLQSVLSGQKQVLLDERAELDQTFANQIALLAEYDAALADNRTATNDARTSALDRADSLREQFDIEQRVTNFTNTATIESLEARQEALEVEKQLILSQLAELKALPVANTALGRQTQESIDKLESQFNALNTETQLLSGSLGDTVQARADEAKAAENQANAVKAVEERTKELDAIQKQRETTLGRLNGLEAQSIKVLEDFARAQSELTQDRQLRDIRELEDYNNEVAQANREHQADLADINKDGNEAIADINADIKDLQTDFYSSEIEATQDYRKDLKKLNRQYQIEDKQALDDHLASLRDAEQNNDVIAFLQAQQSFKQEQKEKETARSEEFKELNNQYNEERQLRRREFNERKQQLQQEINLTRQQTQQKLQEARQAFQQEQQEANQARQLELQRQRQDDQIADQRARQALNRQLADINRKAQAEINAIRQVTSAIGQLQAVANRIAGSAVGSSSSYRGASSSGSTPLGQKSYEQNSIRSSASVILGSSGQRVANDQLGFAFADGGIVNRPTIGMVGEGGRPEAIIPFERSKGLPSALRDYGIMPSGRGAGGAVVHLNFAPNLTVGDIATGNEVSKALQDFANDLTSQLDTGLKRAINQTA
jgi:hypothetical protein